MKQTQYRKTRAILAMAGMVGGMVVGAFGHDGPLVIDEIDADGNGTITPPELTAAAEAEVQTLQANFLAKYDSVPAGQTAGDGIITLAEAKAVFEARAADWLEHLLDTFDTNNDGAITDADTVTTNGRRQPGLHHLESLDTNDDGTVSAAELAAAAKEQAEDGLARFLERYDSVPDGATAGDGAITAAESLAVHRKRVAEQMDAFLDRVDANGDGTVTADELNAVKAPRGKGKAGGPGGRR